MSERLKLVFIALAVGCAVRPVARVHADPQQGHQEVRPVRKSTPPAKAATSAEIVRPAPKKKPEIAILRSDARSLVIEYTPQFTAMDTIRDGNEEFVRAEFAGAATDAGPEGAGRPDVRFRNLAIGVPSPDGNSVQVIASDYEDFRDVAYVPVPTLRVKGGFIEVESYKPDPDRYRDNAPVPSQVAGLSPVRRVRDRYIAGVKVYPLQYNPATKTLRRYKRIVVEVLFGRGALAPGRPGEASLFKNALLNDGVARMWNAAPRVRKVAGLTSSVLSTGTWYRLGIATDGVYQLTPSYLTAAGVNLSGVDPRTIRIFGNGGTEVPEDITQPRPSDLVENAIYVAGESDGSFDPGDYVLFYGRGTRGWTYDPVGKTFHHYIHHYTETNYYWLTFGGSPGKRMQDQPSVSAAATLVPDRFQDHVFIEEEKINLLSSGKDWYGQSIAPGSSFTYLNVLPGLVSNDNIQYRYALVSAGQAQFVVKEWGDQIGINTLPAPSGYQDATGAVFTAAHSSSLPDTVSTLNFAYNPSSISATAWIDWVEVMYPRTFSGVKDFLRFRSPDGNNVVEYHLQNFSTTPMVMNVTASPDVRLVSGLSPALSFRAPEIAGQISEYCATTPASWMTPATIDRMPNEDLRGYASGADFIVLTTPEFMPAANRLAAYRSDPAHGNLKTVVVDVNQIYNEFSGGLPDISGIRDYLYYAFSNWSPRPLFVLLFGEGSYDYKGILGYRSSYVPTWQSPESRDEVYTLSTDDFFVRFGGGTSLSMVLGRIGSRTLAEANTVVDKILRYESGSAHDTWKMRVLFVADDSWTSEGEDGTIHTQDAEDLAEFYTPDEFEKKKIYIAEYPTVWTTAGRRKPGAYQDIIDQINKGALIVNYTGHGNPSLWAHEHIFEVETSIPQLVNSDRLSIFFLATCNFSEFDDAKLYSGGEILMNKPDGGAVGVVAATRKVWAGSNAVLNQQTYARMFTRNSFGRIAVERPATSLFLYKIIGTDGINDPKFFYMGDPTMYLQYPTAFASIDSVNSQDVDSVGGAPRQSPIQLKSLSLVTVSGSVRDAADQVDPSYNGTVSLVVNDATRTATIFDFYPGAPPWYYQATGSTIYRGENSVINGRFTASFIVPRDVSYADSTSRGRFVGYFFAPGGGLPDGAGFTQNIHIGGTDTTAVNNLRGPSISIYLNNRNFRPGDMVSEDPVMYVDLTDSAGINTSASGIGHRIEAWINGATQSQDITDSYVSRLDNFRQGTVQVQLKGLPAGRNSVKVRAWDSFDNAAMGDTYFLVASSDQLSIADVFNYPNPFSSGTVFTFRQNQSTPLSVTVKIYTLAGRLIQTLDAEAGGDSFVRVPWNGRDRDGSSIANGVYLYKLIVKTIDGRFSNEALGKLSVLR